MSVSRRCLSKKRSQPLFARSISRPAHEESCELIQSRSLHREGFAAGKRMGFGRGMPRDAELSSAAASTRWFCSSRAWLSHGDAAVERVENHSAVDTLARQRDGGMASYQNNAAIASVKRNTMAEPIAAIADAIGETRIPQQNAAMVNGTGETSISQQNAAVASIEIKNIGEALVKDVSETLHPRQNVATASNIRGETLIPEGNDLMENLDETPFCEQEAESRMGGSEGEDYAEPGLNMDDVDNASMRVGPQDTKVVQDICDLLDSRGWEACTEATLEERHTMHLSHFIIARVILKQRRVALATSFFQWACKQIGHNVYSYHAYLLKLGEIKHFDEMWELLNEMRDNGCQVTVTTFCIMIKVYGAARMPGMAVDVFRRISEYNVVVDIHLYTTLLSVFFRSDLVGEARLCYSRMLEDGLNLDTSAFSTLIRGFGVSLHIRDVQSCFDIMLKEGCEPDISTYNGLIEGFCRVNAMKNALSTFSALQKRGLKPTVSTFNIIIRAYCRVGRVEDAISMFASMRTICLPNQSTFNILLQGLIISEDISKAINFFKLMKKEGWVDTRSYIYLSNGLRQAKQTQEMLDLLKSLFATHGFANTEVCNALIHNLSYSGKLDEAEQVFRGMVTALTGPSIPSYAIMISCYCRLEKLNEAIELLTELKGQGCKPSVFCYTPIVGMLLKVNRVADAMKCLEEMLEDGVEVHAITYDLLLRALCKQDMVVDALKVCNIVMDSRIPIGILTLFDLMKCLCKLGKGQEANTLFRAMYKQHCLPKCRAISQALGVMNKMSPPYNEKE